MEQNQQTQPNEPAPGAAPKKDNAPYIVLARKYRPQSFSAVIGQDALIRTLKNAIESGRIAHAFMLTGVRGTGKTTTARLIAKALNYKGPDGNGSPTVGPTDDCETCRAISEDRHPDVMEMDAASRTGVDDIREILDGVRYAPTAARYKVYIIDEVHMLSRAAFNALLKTLEEPPPHVIFIFATTEIRKVPVTVLSRCQRFDLRRVDAPTLADYYKDICGRENVAAEDEALTMIARAADGSVRDGLSLLDQAIVLGGAQITAQQVRDMLGLADRGRILDMLEHSLKGETAAALDIMDDLYRNGGDAFTLLHDMLDFTHFLTRLKAVPKFRENESLIAADIIERLAALAATLSMPSLGRTWQILLKGLGEVQQAPNAQAAAEMVIIRLAYAADLPDPGDLLRRLQNQETSSTSSAPASPPASSSTPPASASAPMTSDGGSYGHSNTAAQAAPAPKNETARLAQPQSLEEIEALLSAHNEIRLASELYLYLHPVSIAPGRLEIRPREDARPDLASELGKTLTRLTGTRWMVSISSAPGGPTMAERKEAADKQRLDEACAHPLVAEIIEVFPGTVVKIKDKA